MESVFIFVSAIGGDGDVVEQALPLWQKAVPYLCFAYTIIALWISATRAISPHTEGGVRMKWLAIIFLLPIIGALLALLFYRPSKYQSIPTLAEQKEAAEKEQKMVREEQKVRATEAMESFKPFEE